jgi:hypothetical protein
MKSVLRKLFQISLALIWFSYKIIYKTWLINLLRQGERKIKHLTILRFFVKEIEIQFSSHKAQLKLSGTKNKTKKLLK